MILSVAFCALCIFLRVTYALPFETSVAWGIAAWVFFYIPGRLVMTVTDGDGSGIRGQLHSFALGSALIVPVYSIMRTLHAEQALFPLGGLLIICLAYRYYREPKNTNSLSKGGWAYDSDLPAFAALTFLALVLLHFSFFSDLKITASGYDTHLYLNETYQHLGLVNVLAHTYPPFYPYVSGLDFSHYHIYMHLQIEMMNRLTGTEPLLLTFILMPMIYVFLILWLSYALISRWLGNRVLGVAAGAMMFCTNLAWVPVALGMLPGEFQVVWETLLTPTLYGLINLNGYTPALYVLLLTLYAIREYFTTGSKRQLILFAVLAYTSYGFKSSMGLQLLVLSLLTGVLCWLFCDEKKRARDFAIVSAAALAVLTINLLLVRNGMGNAVASFAPLGEYRSFLAKMNLGTVSASTMFFWPPVYLLLSFGARTAGLLMTPNIFRRNFDPSLMLLVLFSISGVLLCELITIESPTSRKNAAVSFSAQSFEASWLLLAIWLGRFRDKPRRLALALALIGIVSLPTTLQLYNATYHDKRPVSINPDDIAMLDVIRKTPVDSVFIYPLQSVPSPAAHLGGRQAVLDIYNSFVHEWAGAQEATRRITDVGLFFNAMGNSGERARIIKNYSVDYVYGPTIYKWVLDREPLLKQVYQNGSYVLYQVSSTQEDL